MPRIWIIREQTLEGAGEEGSYFGLTVVNQMGMETLLAQVNQHLHILQYAQEKGNLLRYCQMALGVKCPSATVANTAGWLASSAQHPLRHPLFQERSISQRPHEANQGGK